MAPERGGGYRDELEAAHAQIASLEAELRTVRARADNPLLQAQHAARVQERAALVDRLRAALQSRTKSARTTLLLGLIATAIFAASIASLGSAGHPLNALTLGLLVTIVAVATVGTVRNGPVIATRERLRQVEHELNGGVRIDIASNAREHIVGEMRETDSADSQRGAKS